VTIHQSHPLDYIAFDRTMQDIVYKLVPNLETDEYRRYDLSMRRIFLFGLYTTLNKLSNTRVGYQPLIEFRFLSIDIHVLWWSWNWSDRGIICMFESESVIVLRICIRTLGKDGKGQVTG
jgi:hypothetical protein